MLVKWGVLWEAYKTIYVYIQCIYGRFRIKGGWGKGSGNNVNKRLSVTKLCENGEPS